MDFHYRLLFLFCIGICTILLVLLYAVTNLHNAVELLQEQIDYMQSAKRGMQTNVEELRDSQEQLNERITQHVLIHSTESEKDAQSEQLTPFDHIKEDDIRVAGNWFAIPDRKLNWAKYLDTGSMEPIITSSVNGIEITPKKSDDIHIGDIISYLHEDTTIVHRVTKLGVDEEGWYAITKGDNVKREDPIKVRFDQVQGVLIGLIY